MATHERILQKMHEYETKALLALGFTADDPVVMHVLDEEAGTLSYKWYGPGDPPPPRHGFMAMEQASDSAPRYEVHWSHLPPGVWDTILEARREWESNFPRVAEQRSFQETMEEHLRALHRGGWDPESVVGKQADFEFHRWLSEVRRDAVIEYASGRDAREGRG